MRENGEFHTESFHNSIAYTGSFITHVLIYAITNSIATIIVETSKLATSRTWGHMQLHHVYVYMYMGSHAATHV